MQNKFYKTLAGLLISGTMFFNGCNKNAEDISELKLPNFVIKNPDALLHYHQDGFTYKPYIIEGLAGKYLEGVIAEKSTESYTFHDPMVDGRLLDIKDNHSGGFYGKYCKLPENLQKVVNATGNDADSAYKKFRQELCNIR